MKLGSIVQSCNNMVQWVNNGVDVICYLNLWFILVYSGGTWTCKTSITNLWARFNLGDLINFIPLCQFNMFPYLPSCPWWLHREPIPMFWQEVKYRVLFLPFFKCINSGMFQKSATNQIDHHVQTGSGLELHQLCVFSRIWSNVLCSASEKYHGDSWSVFHN